ncbi:MAG: hypothetical protein KAW12_13680 [Candidatus Aminicenantes bacterium]|nr:hypothetical protein [Candidatus Aminicenantes bacterium]
MKKLVTIVFVVLLALTALTQVSYSQEERQEAREEERRPGEEMEIRRLLVGFWRVQLGREEVREIRVFEDLTVGEGEERGKLEIIDNHNLMVLYRDKEKGFEIRFESEDVMMVRSHEEERWVRCERIHEREPR